MPCTALTVRRFFGLVLLYSLATTLHAETTVSYHKNIQPIFENKCVACHACNDAPCQLNLGSAEGSLRGSTKIKVYDGTRTKAQAPTRLFMDAENAEGWKKLGFSSVLGDEEHSADVSLLARMIELGRQQPFVPHSRLPNDIPIGTDSTHQCPISDDELAKFARKYPHRGMPLGVTGLDEKEYETIRTWLGQGAPIDAEPVQLTADEEKHVAAWEALFNQRSNREQLVARWLYEHLFLAHLYFEDLPGNRFYEVVRSRTPSGKPLSIIATPQPNDPPNGPVYYRIRPVQGAIVHKTHITYPLSAKKLEHVRQLFFGSNWNVQKLPGYEVADRANPFITFSAIPAQARYQFMLDNAEYFVRTFIRGPVCRGNIATDVIRDHFWVAFQSPASDIYIGNAEHRQQSDPLLGVPGQKDSMLDLFPQWMRYTKLRNDYSKLRNKDYARLEPKGASFADIWNGDGHNDNALLTIFRHHDSSSVRKGYIGAIPQTIWWMDYPLFERTYYGLVVNFNVYDTVSHQAQTRLYFDLIRHGAETNFLRLMPPASRQPYMDDWYQKSGKLKMWLYYPSLDKEQPTAIRYDSKEPLQEFIRSLLQKFQPINARPDPMNRCSMSSDDCHRSNVAPWIRQSDLALSRLTARPARQLPVINFLPESVVLRVYNSNGQREIYTMLRNRAHSNVAYMAAETLRYQPEKDTLTIYPGIITSYPNFSFNIAAGEIKDFSESMQAANSKTGFDRIVERWGVRRTHPEFWKFFHDFSAYILETEPVEAAILDMNRYENL